MSGKVLGNVICLVGGMIFNADYDLTPVGDVQCYDVTTDTWSAGPSAFFRRFSKRPAMSGLVRAGKPSAPLAFPH